MSFSPHRRAWLFTPFCLSLLLGALQGCGPSTTSQTTAGIRIQGPGAPPNLGFACCENGLQPMQDLLSQPRLVEQLKSLRATVAVPIQDFSPQRVNIVQLLNQQNIPVVAWIVLPREQGYYLTADNAPQAAARVADFEAWTRTNGLRWSAVGLDIEPNFDELVQLKSHRWRLITTLFARSVNLRRIPRARKSYSALIAHIHSLGYPVQIYQMPYIPAERDVHSTLPDRLLGTVDVTGDQNYLMLYTNFARPIGAGMIVSLGPRAEGIAVGSTDGDTAPGTGSGPLDWNEFSRDLIVASHFTRRVGVYDLEGCIRQGFLPRLISMDWSQSVVIPEQAAQRAARVGFITRIILWIVSNLLYLALAALLLLAWLIHRRRSRKKLAIDPTLQPKPGH